MEFTLETYWKEAELTWELMSSTHSHERICEVHWNGLFNPDKRNAYWEVLFAAKISIALALFQSTNPTASVQRGRASPLLRLSFI